MTKRSDWQRLDLRVVWLDAAISTVTVGLLVWLVFFGGGLNGAFISITIFLGGFLFFVNADLIRCITTRFRISDDRVELRYGIVWKVRRSIPRDRIRSVDVTANPLYRVFGLAAVKLGTGQHSGNVEKDELALDAVSVQRAEVLQRQLLRRPEAPTHGKQVVLATFQAKWVRFAVLGLSGFALIGGLIAALGQVLEIINADFEALWHESNRIAAQYALTTSWLAIGAVVLGVLFLGALFSVALYLENWSGYRLVRKTGRTLQLTRGLLFRRSVFIEERRIRGVEYSEPLQIRWAKGALLRVIVSGFGQNENDTAQEASIIMPNAPRAAINKLAVNLLDDPAVQMTKLSLQAHPKAALRRIIVRRLAFTAAIISLLLIAEIFVNLFAWLWVVAALLSLAALATSFDAYRSLGHAILGEYLVTRRGSLLRRTAVLQRSGIIGWKFRQSPFQRRTNLITVTATTAAGRGAYKTVDAHQTEGVAMAHTAVPHLLDAFIE